MWRVISSFGSLGLLLTPVLALAAAPPQTPSDGWVVDWGDRRCTLFRSSGPASFVLSTTPGTGNWEVRLVSRAWPKGALRAPAQLAVSLRPGGDALPDSRWAQSTAAGDALLIYQIPGAMLDKVAAAKGIQVSRKGETVFDIAFPNAGKAVAALRQCEDQVMREWGIDPVAFATLRAPPRGNPSTIVKSSDYPPAAVRANQSGAVLARLAVEADGRVSDCTVVVSSGYPILDGRTCEIFRERFRLTPAIGTDGAPIAAPMMATIRWVLPNR